MTTDTILLNNASCLFNWYSIRKSWTRNTKLPIIVPDGIELSNSFVPYFIDSIWFISTQIPDLSCCPSAGIEHLLLDLKFVVDFVVRFRVISIPLIVFTALLWFWAALLYQLDCVMCLVCVLKTVELSFNVFNTLLWVWAALIYQFDRVMCLMCVLKTVELFLKREIFCSEAHEQTMQLFELMVFVLDLTLVIRLLFLKIIIFIFHCL